MTKKQTRLFFFGGTLVFSLVFIGMTIDSHLKFDELTHADQITPEVVEGQHVWHDNNCINCHTLLGEGAYYAPDLTKITDLRGAAYLHSFLQDPSRFYSEAEDRRLMPNPGLSEREITAVIAFLEWVSNIDNQGWPPRTIRVSGAIQGSSAGAAPSAAASDDPVAIGEALFNSSPPSCVACHSTSPGVVLAGPSLAGIGLRGQERVEDAAYTGSATTAEEYIRESIMNPNGYLVAGDRFSSGGRSLMPDDFGTSLTTEQIDALVAYLMTLH